MRLGKKLILISSAIVVAVLGCGGFLATRANEEFQIRLAKAQALQQADLVTKSVRYHMLTNRREDVQWIVEMIGQQQGIAQVRIFNDTGTVAYAARKGDIGARVDKGAEGCAYCHKRGAKLAPGALTLDAARLLTTAGGGTRIAAMTPIRNEVACHACHAPGRQVLGNLEVVLSIDDLARQIESNHRWSLLLLAALVAIIFAAQSFFVLREITVPVGRLREGFRRVASGDLGARVAVARTGEIAELSRAFNLMTEQLQAAKARIDNWTAELSEQVERATFELKATNQKLEAAGRLKSDFVRNVSHDLRAPLGSITSCLRAALGGYTDDENVRRDLLERACRKTESMALLVNDLLDLAQLGEPKPLQPGEPVDLAIALGKAGDLFQARADEKGIRLEVSCASGVPPVHAAPDDMELLVTNLLDNALKYNRRGGRVTAALGVDGEQVLLTVEDTGIGMSADDLARIFTEFYRSAAARKHEREGTGLGLSIVKKIVERYGGTVAVRSEVGAGTTFAIRFPAGTPS